MSDYLKLKGASATCFSDPVMFALFITKLFSEYPYCSVFLRDSIWQSSYDVNMHYINTQDIPTGPVAPCLEWATIPWGIFNGDLDPLSWNIVAYNTSLLTSNELWHMRSMWEYWAMCAEAVFWEKFGIYYPFLS